MAIFFAQIQMQLLFLESVNVLYDFAVNFNNLTFSADPTEKI